MMAIRPMYQYQKPTLKTNDFRIPVTFFKPGNLDSPEPDSAGKIEVFSCLCHAYSPSTKDMTVLDAHGTQRGLTINIPDTKGEFIPDNSMTAVISDYRYTAGTGFIEWNVVQVRDDFEKNFSIKIILGVSQ